MYMYILYACMYVCYTAERARAGIRCEWRLGFWPAPVKANVACECPSSSYRLDATKVRAAAIDNDESPDTSLRE